MDETVTEKFSSWLSSFQVSDVSTRMREVAILDLVDAAGLCVAAAPEVYAKQLISSWDNDGICTAIGHSRGLDAAGAALLNGVGTHGEDFDDTLEGAPIRVGAMTIPAALAVGERFNLTGERVFLGICAGLEAVCRINTVAPGHIHKAGFHPVGVIGALGAAAASSVTLGLDKAQTTAAFGIAGSLSSGILEYLTEGAWTKRLHPGWAAQSGVKAAIIAKSGFFAPKTVLDGPHSFFKAFAPSSEPDFSDMLDGVGSKWLAEDIVFKPYACGTMIHPYIDCMIELRRRGVKADQIARISCKTGEGLVHRLWEPLAAKHLPPSGYAAKFSMPFCMAVSFFDGDAGLNQFSDERVEDPEVLRLAERISYEIDPKNEYPRNYTGHIKVELCSGEIIEIDQPHMRGGKHEPLTEKQITEKFANNCAHGGWKRDKYEALLEFLMNIASRKEMASFGRVASAISN